MPIIRTVLALGACLIFLAPGFANAAAGDPGCQLDIDGSGVVDEADLQQCTTILQIFPPIYNPACDANGDGILSTIDLAAFLSFLGLDCTAAVPAGSFLGRIALVGFMLLASALAMRSVRPRQVPR